jgi:serine protease
MRRLLAVGMAGLIALGCAAEAAVSATTVSAAPASGAAVSAAAPYRQGVVLVGYLPDQLRTHDLTATLNLPTSAAAAVDPGPGSADAIPSAREVVLHLSRRQTVAQAIARLRGRRGVAYAVPDYLARAAAVAPAEWIPDDPGRTGKAGGWEQMQWNFLPGFGINAPAAWANLRADGHPGGRGVVVAVLDTGVAYRSWEQFRRLPDFDTTRFTAPYDFVAGNRYPLDRLGHGTFVAGMVAESTNNGLGLAGVAYGATIMPVRVLDKNGEGDAITISRGIRYAVAHGARVINLSLEFPPEVGAGQLPGLLSALDYAHRHNVVVVASAGNEGENRLAYPARAGDVISVGATTRDRCLALYSNAGHRLDLVAPGGGDDASLAGDPQCDPGRSLPDIFQMTFGDPSRPDRFGYPGGWIGTSMASAHVAAVAALVIASGVLGRHPTPDQVLARLESTAQPLGGSRPNSNYGYGLVDAGAATARP